MRVRLIEIKTRKNGKKVRLEREINVESVFVGRGPDNDLLLKGLTKDNSTAITFIPTLSGTVSAVVTGTASTDVTILDPWVVDGTYATQDADFVVSAGSNRIVLIALSAEKNAGGPMDVTSVSLGNRVLTELVDITAGAGTGYHNLHWFGYLLESNIASRTGDMRAAFGGGAVDP